MTELGVYASFDRDPARDIEEPDCCYPCPENGDCDPILCHKFMHDLWERGRCFNCGCWAQSIADGEYECQNCGDIWNIYEEPEVP